MAGLPSNAQLSRRAFAAATVGTILFQSASLAQPARSVTFRGRIFVHRWSQPVAGQHEFTPGTDADLSKWADMLTINVYDDVRDGEALAVAANRVLSKFQSSGKILRTLSKPRTADSPAEHFIAAVLGTPQLLEAVFARLLLRETTAYSVVCSHRIYGNQVGSEMGLWLSENGAQIEAALMSWAELPPLADLKALR